MADIFVISYDRCALYQGHRYALREAILHGYKVTQYGRSGLSYLLRHLVCHWPVYEYSGRSLTKPRTRENAR